MRIKMPVVSAAAEEPHGKEWLSPSCLTSETEMAVSEQAWPSGRKSRPEEGKSGDKQDPSSVSWGPKPGPDAGTLPHSMAYAPCSGLVEAQECPSSYASYGMGCCPMLESS